ncbi:MAG TPA: hypothetical protein VFM02_01795, partial [Candidatus Paceibacterota bacterium]|nr:hypothetical protein [Candidatus Paceibacterota bacterium]
MADTTIKCTFVHCFDPRFPQAFGEVRENFGVKINECDEISIGGGAGGFDDLEEELEKSKRLHNPDFVILAVHENCGAGAKEEDLEHAEEIARACGFTDVRKIFVTLENAKDARRGYEEL